MSKPKPSRPSPSAIPILMRLPDLRRKTGSRGGDVPRTEALLEEARVPETPQEEPSDNTGEVPHQSPPQSEQVAQAAASSTPIADPPASTPDEEMTSGIEASVDELASAAPTSAETAAPSDEKEVLREKEAASEVVATKTEVTNASPANSAEPVTPAAARRQRALERQRRQTVDPPPQRSWWTTHLPIIAIGFVIALVLTIYAGRRNRVQNTVDSQAAIELPVLDIDTGDGRDSLSPSSSEPGMLTVDKTDEGGPAGLDASPKAKSPPLLSARPKLAEAQPPAREESRPASDPVRTAARPSNTGAEITNHFVTSPGADGATTAAEVNADPSTDYPNTEPAVYRPGGRVPREARVPNYPQTSTPHLR